MPREATAAASTPDRLAARIKSAAESLLGGPAAIADARKAGLAVLEREGLPRAKVEAWKYTALGGLATLDLDPAKAPAPQTLALDEARLPSVPDALRIVIVNGAVRPDLSASPLATTGATIVPLSAGEALPDWATSRFGKIMELERMPLAAANAAVWRNGIAIRATAAAKPARLHLVFVTSGSGGDAMASPRVLIALDAGTGLDVIESHVGETDARGRTFANGVAEIDVARDATFRHFKLVDENTDDHHVWASAVTVAEGAHYEGFLLTVGGAIVRNEVRVRFLGPNAEARINGAYAVGGSSHVDNTTFMDHAVPHARSTQVFKGVVGGAARAVYQGKVLVRADAQKTDAQQLHKAMMLSEAAEVDAKPELEIYADDVKCGHGAAIGRLDEDLLFYLLARGIERERARELLLAAFLGEALEGLSDETVRGAFAAALERRLAAVQSEAK